MKIKKGYLIVLASFFVTTLVVPVFISQGLRLHRCSSLRARADACPIALYPDSLLTQILMAPRIR